MTEFFDTCLSSIMLQETALRDTIEGVNTDLAAELDSVERVIITGCGDSYAAATYGQWCLHLLSRNSIVVSPPEIVHVPVDDETLVIGVTASGRSLVTIDAVKYARGKGAKTVALTDDPDGPICKDVDMIWTTNSGVSTYNTSPSAPSTAAMVFMLALTANMKDKQSDALKRDISQLKTQGKMMIEWANERGQEIATLVDSSKLVYLIGEGPNHVAAQIGMMKFDEYSLVKGIAAKTEEFRHHYNLSVKDGEPTVVITYYPPSKQDSVYLQVIRDTLQMDVYHLHNPERFELESPLAQSIPNMIALQFGAYYNAFKLNPNKSGFREPHASSFKIY